MKELLKAPAKLNLTLDILGKDEKSGYHFMQSVMQEIPWLYDEIEIEIDEGSHEQGEGRTEILKQVQNDNVLDDCNYDIPTDRNNLVWQAVEIMRRETGRMDNVFIKIRKFIPPRTGLGGGSSDAAAVLKFLNKFWGLKKSRRLLSELAAEIGMDCCFFIWGGTCLVSGFGEKVEQLSDLKISPEDLQIIFYQDKLSTAEAYKALDLSKCAKQKQDTEFLVRAIQKGHSFEELKKYFHNDFGDKICGSGAANFNY